MCFICFNLSTHTYQPAWSFVSELWKKVFVFRAAPGATVSSTESRNLGKRVHPRYATGGDNDGGRPDRGWVASHGEGSSFTLDLGQSRSLMMAALQVGGYQNEFGCVLHQNVFGCVLHQNED